MILVNLFSFNYQKRYKKSLSLNCSTFEVIHGFIYSSPPSPTPFQQGTGQEYYIHV
jgi:hypothetical protein